MNRGLDYGKLIDLFCAEFSANSQAKEGDRHHINDTQQAILVERITLQRNGEVQISSWERLADEVRGCERYRYRPNRKELKKLIETFGPLEPEKPKTVRKKWLNGNWVKADSP